MKIQLSQIHIKNFRSIEEAEIRLSQLAVLFGMNDSGKTNLLYALKLAFGGGNISDSDIFVSPNDPFSRDKSLVIDMMFIPIDDNGKRTEAFDDSWAMHLGENVSVDENDNEFFAYRTEYIYNDAKEDYTWERKQINVWKDDDIVIGKGIGFKTLSVFDYVFLDAHRDIAIDIRDKGSLWNKQIAKIKMPDDIQTEIENSLNSIGNRIKSESPFLQEVEDDLSAIANMRKSKIEISPITRNINELYKGLDIYVTPESSNSFSISNLGLGTRGRAVFSILKSIIKKRFDSSQTSPYFCLLALEEPEAHIYPHAQRQLIHAFRQIKGQQIITTHSPYILSTSNINNLIKVYLQGASSKYISISDLLIKEEILRVERFVLNTRGEILFSNITILSEGETEEQALQIFFNEYFGKTSFELGVNIVGVGGTNYLPFLQILEKIGTKWFIFSDGEDKTINNLKKCMQKLRVISTDIDLGLFDNIIILNDSHNYESYLVSNGYYENIVMAINEFEINTQNQHRSSSYFDNYKNIYAKNHKDTPPDKILIDCMENGKFKYASIIAKTICDQNSDNKKFPQKIRELMEKVKVALEV
jgi:putative ATP-dependent endonuclease of OLD family